MAAQFRDILTGIYTALRANHATYDLRTTNDLKRVVWDDGQQFPMFSPLVVLGGLSIRTTYGSANLGSYDNNGSLEWYGFVSAPDLDPENRMLAAVDLANDVITALQNAHHTATNTTIYNTTQLLPTLEDVFGDGYDELSGFGVAWGRVTWQRISQSGI